jgi:predicted transcriptional regulator
MKKLFALSLVLVLFSFSEWPVPAQEQPAEQPSAEEVEKQKAEREKNAYRLLDQVIDEAQSLRLVENRVRVQINAADMLWDQNQGRARSLFSMAAEGVAELGRSQPAANNRRGGQVQDGSGNFIPAGGGREQNFRSVQLRQELVLAAARHDAALAYQLLATTKPPAAPQNTAEQRGPRAQLTSEENLEQALLARIAALDPKLAAQNAEQMIEKGQFPRAISEVINQLHQQDPEAAEKLADKIVKKIQAANILANNDASMLAQSLIIPGPRPPASESTNQGAKTLTASVGRAPALEQSLYVELLSSVIDAALKVTPGQTPQRGQANQRRVQAGPGVSRPTSGPQQPSDAQMEQNNARRLLAGLQPALPVIDQFLPAKAQLVRQKMTEMGMANSTMGMAQAFAGLQQGNYTADALVQAAASAPQQMQSRLYQQAAIKALDEGDTERARQIATDHLQNNARDTVMQRIDFREMVKKGEGARLDEIRQTIARLQTDREKIDLIVQVAGDVKTDNPKLAIQLLEEAKQLTNRRATSYEHFEQQLKVARAFATVDAARSFEVLEPGISQLNELLAAAAVLSGFEINMFRDGEMAIQGGNGLTGTINRFGQELAVLARNDFERSETLAGRFQFAEPRIMTRMAIVQGLLGVRPVQVGRISFGGGRINGEFIVQPD